MAEAGSEAARVVGERIRKLRNDYGISQMELGDLAGMHFTNIGKIERGDVSPGLATLVRISAALKTDPGDLVTGITVDQLPGKVRRITVADLLEARERDARS